MLSVEKGILYLWNFLYKPQGNIKTETWKTKIKETEKGHRQSLNQMRQKTMKKKNGYKEIRKQR